MFLSLVQGRRSIRKFQDKPIEKDKLDTLIEIGLRSPSSMGKNPWCFIVVEDKALLKNLAAAKQFGSAFLENAPLAIVVCADPGISDVWVEDASIAAIYLHLAAESIGLGSCWVQIRERMRSDGQSSQDYLSELLHIPSNIKTLALVAIGYPDEEKPGHKKETLQYDKVFLNAYGAKQA